MRILVCGGRHYDRPKFVRETLDALHREQSITAIISGGCTGADTFAAEWAKKHGVALEVYKADWYAHGRAAGPIRNQEMLDKGRPELVVAFPGGRGTEDMARKAAAAGVRVLQAGRRVW
jgi:hypothetical protein